ncbi:hypothetical protein [uncultured Draconibacterium sp.]|uniref:hypothetical protein n=1 Tax=uncultured Draconibacterium sp. TaxID=1573823 RepID=UPI0029C99D35|nr:hypothetical protein [uncultured Draconibacterium sp.]
MKNSKQHSFVILYLVIILFSSVNTLNAQNKTYLGIDFVNEVADKEHLRPGVGLNVARTFSKHSGIEAGVYYRTYLQSMSFRVDGYYFDADIRENHLSIPVLYKFSSRIVNFSAGPSFDVFLGWKEKSSIGAVEVESYDIDPEYNLGAMVKLGKDLKLSEKLVFEPELRLNPIFSLDRVYVGLGLKLKLDI